MHSSIKRFTDFVALNIRSFLLECIEYCTFRCTKFKTGQFEAAKTINISRQKVCGPIYGNIYGVVSVICIDRMYDNLLLYCKLHSQTRMVQGRGCKTPPDRLRGISFYCLKETLSRLRKHHESLGVGADPANRVGVHVAGVDAAAG